MKDFIFLGGDLRFIYAAAKLNKKYHCSVYGFDTLHEDILKQTGVSVTTKIHRAKNVILPLPMSRNCDYITAPYYSGKIPISAVTDAVGSGGTVYCGKACPYIYEICKEKALNLVDYYEREELTVVNAVITAEGALEIIMKEKALAIVGMKVLVIGYGRIAKVLSKYLHALGAKVTIIARKYDDLAWARTTGCSAVHFNDTDRIKSDKFDFSDFDTVVNTVPAVVLGHERLIRLKNDCLVIDLASKAGVDLESAKELGVKVIWALSLPGKVAPVTSGEIIAETLLNIIKEKKGGNYNE